MTQEILKPALIVSTILYLSAKKKEWGLKSFCGICIDIFSQQVVASPCMSPQKSCAAGASVYCQKSTCKQPENPCLAECSCDCHADGNWASKSFTCQTNKEIHYNLISDLHSLCEVLCMGSVNSEPATRGSSHIFSSHTRALLYF